MRRDAGRALERVLRHLPEAPERGAAEAEGAGLAAVTEEARSVGLLPLLAHYLPRQFSISREEVAAARFRSVQLERATVAVVRLLEGAGVAPVVLKGAVLGRQLYPEPWLRPATDVDVLVGEAEVDRAKGALEAAGWQLQSDPRGRPLDYQHSVNFIGPGKVFLELHYGISRQHQLAAGAVEGLVARARKMPLAEGHVSVLQPADDVVHQCLHATAHTFDGVKWLFDLKRTVGQGAFSWDEVVARADQLGAKRSTGMAPREVRERLGAAVPGRVLRELGPGRTRRALVHAAMRFSPEMKRTRAYLFDLFLPEQFDSGWLLRAASPLLKRLGCVRGPA